MNWLQLIGYEPHEEAPVIAPKPKPRLASVKQAPTRDEFKAWRDDPTTLFVFAALRRAREAQKEQWDAAAWDGGKNDDLLLTELRTRADAYASLEEGSYEDFCGWAEVEPDRG
jgi:hypothetical protein